MKVTVAPLFSDWPVFDSPHKGMDPEVEWDARPTVELEVQDSETLGDTLARAAEQLGVTVAPDVAESEGGDFLHHLTFFAFHIDGDRTAVRAGYGYRLTLVREDGLAYWNQDFKPAKWGEIMRASEAGLLGNRDPQRLYLVLTSPAGNGALLVWSHLLAALGVLGTVLGATSDTEGALSFAGRLKERFSRADKALQESYLELEERGALPDNFAESLGQGPWHVGDLAEKFGVSDDRAQGILEGFGFAEAESGLWRLKADPEAEFFYNLRSESEIAHTGEHAERPDIALRERLEEYVRTGERPELPEHFQFTPWLEKTEDEALKESRELQEQMEREGGFDSDFMEGMLDEDLGTPEDEGMGVPVEDVILKCACGDPECRARLSFERAEEKLRLVPEDWDDHFVVKAEFLGMLGFSVAEETGGTP